MATIRSWLPVPTSCPCSWPRRRQLRPARSSRATSSATRLMAAEATGAAGGASAQQWLYPLLTHTAFEQGIPAGVPVTATVVHKTGELDSVTNDVALVLGGAHGPYVVAICVDGPGSDAGFSVIAQVASLVWQMESAR